MTKTAVILAQQRWEYKELTRKTEEFLVNDLNEHGKVGWELVSVSYNKAPKSGLGEAFVWTAFLKRPLVHHPGDPPPDTTAEAAETPPSAAKPSVEPKAKPSAEETEPEIFDLED